MLCTLKKMFSTNIHNPKVWALAFDLFSTCISVIMGEYKLLQTMSSIIDKSRSNVKLTQHHGLKINKSKFETLFAFPSFFLSFFFFYLVVIKQIIPRTTRRRTRRLLSREKQKDQKKKKSLESRMKNKTTNIRTARPYFV